MLDTTLRLADPDAFYEALIDMHRDLEQRRKPTRERQIDPAVIEPDRRYGCAARSDVDGAKRRCSLRRGPTRLDSSV